MTIQFEDLITRLDENKFAFVFLTELSSVMKKGYAFNNALISVLGNLVNKSQSFYRNLKGLKSNLISIFTSLLYSLITPEQALSSISINFKTNYIRTIFLSLSKTIEYSKKHSSMNIESLAAFLKVVYLRDLKLYKLIKANQTKLLLIIFINSIGLGLITALMPFFSIFSFFKITHTYQFPQIIILNNYFYINAVVILLSYIISSYSIEKHFFPKRQVLFHLILLMILYLSSLAFAYFLLYSLY
ncbi:MAG: hypothetical protein ACP6IU_07620 [Candidatus Asgardarchaeia archaeon]